MRNIRTHLVADSPTGGLVPKHLTKQEFGRRVYNLMVERGWHQSELARRSGLPRDAISTYVRGKVLPTPASLQMLADTFGVPAETLLPNYTESAIDADNPSLEVRVSTSAPNKAWLRVNRLVSLTTAVKIVEMLNRDDPSDRAGSGGASEVQHNEG